MNGVYYPCGALKAYPKQAKNKHQNVFYQKIVCGPLQIEEYC